MDERQIKILLIDKSLTEAHGVQDMLAQVDRRMFSMYCAETLVAALDLLARHEFDVGLVDLSLPDSDGLETLETIRRHAPTLPIVIYASVQNEALALKAVEQGAQDYLIKGRMTSAALVRVLQFSVARQRNQAQTVPAVKKAPIIGFMGVKGGVGSTTIACNFSIELSKQSREKTLLLDLDAAAASSTLLMQIKSEYSVLEATKNLHRLDADYWRGVVCTTPYGVDVLQAPGAFGFTEPLVAERVRHLLRFTQFLYGSIIVDLGRLSPLSLNLLDEIKQIYVVSSEEIPDLYEAGRVLRKLKDLGLGEQFRLILNRVPKSSLGSKEGLEKVLGCPAFCKIPECSKELMESYSVGRFTNAGTSLQKAVSQLVGKSLGRDAKSPARNKSGLFNLANALGYSRKTSGDGASLAGLNK